MDASNGKVLNDIESTVHVKTGRKKHHHKGRSAENHANRDVILNELGICSGQIILDAGCGNGYMSKEFSNLLNNTGKVYALDPDEVIIERLKEETKGTNIETIVGDISRRTQIESGSIDLIYLSTVFHGFSKDEIDGFQKEVKRLLKSNALLAIVEFKKIKTPFGPPVEIRYSPEELREALTFEPKSLAEVGEYFYIQSFKNT